MFGAISWTPSRTQDLHHIYIINGPGGTVNVGKGSRRKTQCDQMCLPEALMPDYTPLRSNRCPARPFSAQKNVPFPQKPLSVHFPSWLPHPPPATWLRDSGWVYLGAVTTCYTLNNEDYKWLHNTAPQLTSTEPVGSQLWGQDGQRPVQDPGFRELTPLEPLCAKSHSEEGVLLTTRT